MRISRTARGTDKKLRASVLVAVALSLSVFVLVFFGISGGSVGAQEAATDPVLVGAGDIARCAATGDEATADLITNIARDNVDGTTVFTTGDNVYPDGTPTDFDDCYKPSWGGHKEITKPAVGNHEYNTPGASGYYGYFGAVAGDPDEGYYSYDLGDWHIVVLNSNCSDPTAPACVAGSPQEQWLRDDLAAHPNTCTLAYFHHPRFSSGNHGNDLNVAPFWRTLYQAGADVVLNGHAHVYERFAPQNPSGQVDPTQGIREFVVGTGGANLSAFETIQPNSVVRIAEEYGVLKMTLRPEGYDWEFRMVDGTDDGAVADSGTATCSSAQYPSPTDTTAPTVQEPQEDLPPGGTLGASAIPTRLSWSASDDKSGVASYELQQSVNGGAFTKVSLPSATSTDKRRRLEPGSTYEFRVRATDGSGNTSEWATGPELLVDAYQEDHPAIVYAGSWTQQALSSAHGGGLKYSDETGSAAQFTFTGRNVAWVPARGPDGGRATVSIDGVVVKTVDLYSPTNQSSMMVFSQPNLDPEVSHTIEITVSGTKNIFSSGTRVDVDAFVVLR